MKAKKVPEKKDADQHLVPTPYTPEYKKECEEFPARFQLIKTNFKSFIDNTRALLNNTPLIRGDYNLDDTRKKELEQCLENWKYLMTIIDHIENNVKKITNELLWCFQGNASGEVFHKFYMINEIGYADAGDKDSIFLGTEVVPDVLPLYLFDLQALFMLLASCTVTAWKTQQDIIAIFENKPQKTGDHLNEELKPFWDLLLECKEQMDTQNNDIRNLLNIITCTTKIQNNKQNVLATNIISGFQSFCKTNITHIPNWIKTPSVYTIVKMLNKWNQYNKATRDAQAQMSDYEPYPRYRDILYGSNQFIIKWGEKVFAPLYIKMKIKKKLQREENNRKKGRKRPDALDRRKYGGKDGEAIIDLYFFEENTDIYFDEHK